MKLDFTQNTKKGIVAGAISRGLALFFPFLNRTLFLRLLGPAYLGLNGLFASILGVLSLAELGFGTAVLCSMYKPIADNDQELVCAYLRFYRTIYRWVGSIIFIVGLCLLPFLRDLVHGDLPPDMDLHILYLLHLLNTALSYFLFAYQGVIIGAYQRPDVTTNINTVLSLLQYLAVFAILTLTRNYYCYVITTIFFTAIRNLLIMCASRRLFPKITPRGELAKEKRRKVISDVKAIFMHKVGTVISYSIDNLLLSASLGLAAVATYGNYYYVYTVVAGIPAIVYSTMMGGFGNKIHTESREDNFKLFIRVYRLVGIVIIWCAAMMLALYQPFIKLWMGHKYATLALHFLTPALLVLYFCINQSRQVLLTYKSAAGLWREDRWKPVISGAVKLGLGLLFIHTLPAGYKIDGVILSTIVGYVLVQIPWESHVMFTAFFNREQAKVYWLEQVRFAFLTLIVGLTTLAAVRLMPLDWADTLFTRFRIPEKIGKFAEFSIQGLVALAVAGTFTACLFRKDIGEVTKKLLHKK